MALLHKPVAHFFFTQCDNYKHLYFMQDTAHHILCFLFVRGLATTFLLSGVGIEGQQNGLLHHVPFSLHIIYICGVDELE
jgi:hypothetical protein